MQHVSPRGTGRSRSTPDPPNSNKISSESLCPNSNMQATHLGENEGEQPRPSEGDVAMGEEAADEKEVEEVQSTQF